VYSLELNNPVGFFIMKDYAEQTFSREAKSYIRPLMIADHLAARAFQKGKYAAHDAQAALVFFAFAIEAFCNHIGWKLSSDFAEFDKLCAKKKLQKTSELVGLDMSLGERPFQTFHDIGRFRNGMAHSRTQEVQSILKVPRPFSGKPTERPKPPPTEWEAYCTPEVLIRAQEDVRKGLKVLYDASKLGEQCPFDKENWSIKTSWELERMKKEPTEQ
jgi:hypothetical protein